MEELSEVENVNLLKVDGVTRKTRCKSTDPVSELRGPILAPGCSRVCSICVESLDKKKLPTLALANGLWVGEIPDELQNLTYAEQLLIARVRHNRCIVKVSSGMCTVHMLVNAHKPKTRYYSINTCLQQHPFILLYIIHCNTTQPTSQRNSKNSVF